MSKWIRTLKYRDEVGLDVCTTATFHTGNDGRDRICLTTAPGDGPVILTAEQLMQCSDWLRDIRTMEPMTATKIAANPPTFDGLKEAQEAFIEPIVDKTLEILGREEK